MMVPTSKSDVPRLLDEVFIEDKPCELLFLLLHPMKSYDLDGKGNTIFHYAAKTRDVKKFKMVAGAIDAKHRDIINIINNYGQHAFHVAVGFASVEVFRYFIDWGKIDVNVKVAIMGFTALHIAVWYRRYDIIKFFCEECPGVDFTAVDRYNRTAFTLAQECGHYKIMNLLKRHEPKVMQGHVPLVTLPIATSPSLSSYMKTYENYEKNEKKNVSIFRPWL